jgi:L-lactate dehydrogenase complex protein LldG
MGAKENILARINEALQKKVPQPFSEVDNTSSIFVDTNTDLVGLFEKEYKSIQGNFYYCENETELQQKLAILLEKNNWQKVFFVDNIFSDSVKNVIPNAYADLPSCDVSITDCESLVARTGTIVLSTAQASGRTTSVYAPAHICIAHTSQLVFDMEDALAQLQEKYNNNFPSFVTFASGPSRTADIEKTLVTGVHGPKEIHCFLVKN